jgi:hypothetical protein
MMQHNPTAYFGQLLWIVSGAAWAAALLIGGLWLVWADDPGWKAIPLAAALASTMAAGIMWQQSRARRRWRAALDAYAERELSRQRRRTALKRVQTLSTALGISSSVGLQLKPGPTRRRGMPDAERRLR